MFNTFAKIVSEMDEDDNILDAVSSFLKNYLSVDIVGIRLIDVDGDAPYQAITGLSESSESGIKKRIFLCSPENNKRPLKKCLCGKVLTDDTENETIADFVTVYGSVYVSSVSSIQQKQKIKKPYIHNSCNLQGYETIALVPIKFRSKIKGIIQIGSKKKDTLSEKQLSQIELLGAFLGEVIHPFVTEVQKEAQKQENERKNLHEMASEVHDLIQTKKRKFNE